MPPWQAAERPEHIDLQMTKIFFEYYPGHVDVRFIHDKVYQDLRLWVRLRGEQHLEKYVDDQFNPAGEQLFEAPIQNVSCRISPVFCPFHNYLKWLEAIVIDVQECAWEWEAEGPDGRMVWRRGHSETGLLEIIWPRYEIPEKQVQIMLYRHQMVEMFYRAFRRFVESPAYDPFRYERLSLRESLTGGLGNFYTLEEIIGYLINMDWQHAGQLIDAILNRGYQRGYGKHSRFQYKEDYPQIRQPMDFETCLKMYARQEFKSDLSETWNE